MAKIDERSIRCSFCGKRQDQVKRILSGPNVYICDECVDLCSSLLHEDMYETQEPAFQPGDKLPTPKEIKAYMDGYIIGQEDAKRTLSVSVYNHYKRIFFGGDSKVELQKSNILLIGPTGCGKTLFAQTLAKILNVPFAIADATTLTEAGYVGEDVENILLRLLQAADFDVELAERGIIYIDEMDKIIEARTDRSSIGFGSEISSKSQRDLGKLFQQVQPHDLLKFGIIPELVGRLPVITTLRDLKKEDLIRILTEPHNALCRQYEQLLDFDQVQLQFEPEALEAVAQKAIDRKIGARGLRAVLEDLMIPIMYEIPSDPDVERVVITKRCVEEGCAPDIYRKGAKALEPGEHAAGA